MDNENQIFIGSNGLSLPSFYPDDLPSEWKFDYYSSNISALSLNCDSSADLEEVLGDIDDNFKLVINVDNTLNLQKLLKAFYQYRDKFILFATNVDAKLLDGFQFCIKSDKKIKNCKNIDDLYFNTDAVIFVDRPDGERNIRNLLEKVAKHQENIVLIQNNTDSETLEKTKVISELLGY